MTEPKKPNGGARPGAGRKPGTGREGVRRTLLLSHAALAVLEAVPERQRGAWVSAAIEAAGREPDTSSLSVARIEERVREIASHADSLDDEAAHAREDALWWDVLGSIADGRDDAAAAAEAARKTSQIHFTRYRI